MGLFGLSGEQTQANALLFLLIGTVGLAGVFKMCLPFTKIKTFFAVTSAIGFYAAIAVCLWLQITCSIWTSCIWLSPLL
ncbi:MAG: hypothetical protein ACLT29_08055 [Ruminococcus callidus]